MKIVFVIAILVDPDKNFIWVFTVCQTTHQWASIKERVKCPRQPLVLNLASGFLNYNHVNIIRVLVFVMVSELSEFIRFQKKIIVDVALLNA